MPNLVPKTMNDWMRRQELRIQDLVNRRSDLVPVRLKDASDLDGFLYPGRYFRESATGTTTALGYPQDGASGSLDVIRLPDGTQVQQVFFDRASGVTWIRWHDGSSWSAWTSGVSDDTGWVTITNFATGFSGQGGNDVPMIRRYGPVVAVRGRANASPAIPDDSLTTVCTVPSGFEPPAIWEQARARNQAAPVSRLFVDSSGAMRAANSSGETTVTLSSTWMVG